MGMLTKDPKVLLRRWMVIYMNLNILQSTDTRVSATLSEMKDKLAEANEYVMRFFDLIEVELEAED